MKTKPILITLGLTVVYFLLGWVVYGMMLMNFYASNMTPYEGLMKEPAPWVYLIGNLCTVGMLIYIFTLAGIKDFVKGMTTGIIILFLVTFSYDLMMLTGMNLYNSKVFFVDILVGTCFGGILGGLGGFALGKWE